MSRTKHLKPFQPGETGNPVGRPKGSRNKLGEAFVAALHDDFVQHGPETIVKAREEQPAVYLKVIASLLPKEMHITDVSELTADEIVARLREIAAFAEHSGGTTAGGAVPLAGSDRAGKTGQRTKLTH